MSLDLTFMVIDHLSPELCFSHTIISTDQDYDFYKAVKELDSKEFKHFDFSCLYDREHINNLEDAFGTKMRSVEANKFIALKDFKTSDKNKAIIKFFIALPINTKILLYWH